MNYKGIKCPVCEKPFTEDDDIVVCPKCGAPYHRTCYVEKGDCIFTELHESGGTWMPPPPPEPPDTANEIKDKECPNCGVLNAHSALFCNICGASLTGSPDEHRNTPPKQQAPNNTGNPNQNGYPPPPPGVSFYGVGGAPFAFDPMGGVNPMENLADGVTYGDVSKVVLQNSAYYMSTFKNLNTYKKNKFNFSAFLFSGGWLLYRKQYKPGILISALMLLLYLGRYALSYFVSLPIMQSALDASGASFSDITYMQAINYLVQYLQGRPMDYLLFCTPLICLALMLVVMILVGIFGNKMYMKHCIRTVQKIKATSHSESDIAAAYNTYGGVNSAAALCVFGCYMVLQWVTMFMV